MRMATRRRRRWIATGGATAAVAIGVWAAVAWATPTPSAPSPTNAAPVISWGDNDAGGPAPGGYDVAARERGLREHARSFGTFPVAPRRRSPTSPRPPDGTYCYRVTGHGYARWRHDGGTAPVALRHDCRPPSRSPRPDRDRRQRDRADHRQRRRMRLRRGDLTRLDGACDADQRSTAMGYDRHRGWHVRDHRAASRPTRLATQAPRTRTVDRGQPPAGRVQRVSAASTVAGARRSSWTAAADATTVHGRRATVTAARPSSTVLTGWTGPTRATRSRSGTVHLRRRRPIDVAGNTRRSAPARSPSSSSRRAHGAASRLGRLADEHDAAPHLAAADHVRRDGLAGLSRRRAAAATLAIPSALSFDDVGVRRPGAALLRRCAR